MKPLMYALGFLAPFALSFFAVIGVLTVGLVTAGALANWLW